MIFPFYFLHFKTESQFLKEKRIEMLIMMFRLLILSYLYQVHVNVFRVFFVSGIYSSCNGFLIFGSKNGK